MATLMDVQKGWKVYAASEELGRVEDVGPNELLVERGTLLRHHYRVPAEYVAEAAEGVVDLTIDRDAVKTLQTMGKGDRH